MRKRMSVPGESIQLQEVNVERKARMLAVELGYTGTFELDHLAVDRVRPQLTGDRGRLIYERMKSDSTVSSVLFAIEMMLRRSRWKCFPTLPKDPKAVEYADFFESLRNDMSLTWENFITNVMSMLTYGWSFFEIVAKRRMGYDAEVSSKYNDGMWGIRKLAFRAQTTLDDWILDDNGGVKAMQQRVYIKNSDSVRIIPIEKGLLFRAGFWKDSPEGESPLRGAYDPWILLQGINRAEAYGIERELNGLPVIRVPADLIQASRNGDPDSVAAMYAYEQIVRDLRLNRQAGVILPSDHYQNADGTVTAQKQYELQLLSSNGTRSINVQSAAERHQVAIARCVLADFLMLGTSSRSGSQALGESRANFFATAIDGWNSSIADVLNRFLIPRLGRINGFDMTLLPEYKVDPANPIDIETTVNCIQKYVQAGGILLPNEDLDEEICRKLQLPLPDADSRARSIYDPSLDPSRPAGGSNPRGGGTRGSVPTAPEGDSSSGEGEA